MRKKFLLFDLDGTLIDTLPDLTNAINFMLKEMNYPLRSLEEIRKFIGNGTRELVARSIPEGKNNPKYEECFSLFYNYYRTHAIVDSLPYENMKETLYKLKAQGYRLAVLTNKNEEIAVEMIEHFYPGIFDVIQGNTKKVKPKPDPSMVKSALKRLSFFANRRNSILIGDSEVDKQTAVNSKMDCLLVTYGFRNKNELDKLISRYESIDEPLGLLKIFIKK